MEYRYTGTSFELKDVFECGQCFRWNKEEDGSYVGIVGNNVIKVKKEGGEVVFIGNNFSLNEIEKYFDLKRDYETIKEELSKKDEYMKRSIEYGSGIRILKQDLWEMIISFIISANNNIPRIKLIIERLSAKYGKEIEFEGKTYYSFPTAEDLKDLSAKDFRELGVGFRDIRLYETKEMILNKEVDLEAIYEMDTDKAREELLKLSGVGPKVADCILLFSDLSRFDVFPIDVWVRRVMNDLYFKSEDETKLSKKEIQKMADEKFGNLKGIAQQYLFYWRRENADNIW